MGKLLTKACQDEGIALINIVRSDKQVEQLKAIGSKYNLNSESKTFSKDFMALSKELKPKAFFDAVAGKTGSIVASLMPFKSTVYTYGNLSRSNYNFDPSILIFKNLHFEGVWLNQYAKTGQIAQFAANTFEKMSSGAYKTTFAKEFSPQDFKEALKYYSENASAGKVLIVNPKYASQKL